MSGSRKANYNQIAPIYDQGRYFLEKNLQNWLDLIAKYSQAKAGAKVLDLGCGTGRFAIPFAQRLGFKVTGADKFPEMLKQAAAKDPKRLVTWEHHDADALTYAPNSFDMVFMSHLIHHLDNPLKTIADCKQILKPGGAIIIRYGSIDQIRNDIEHTFFPETVAIDEERTPSTHQLEQWLSQAGFNGVDSHEVNEKRFFSGPEEHLERVKSKFTSVLTLIPEVAFNRGVKKLERYISEHPDDPALVTDSQTLTIGYKP